MKHKGEERWESQIRTAPCSALCAVSWWRLALAVGPGPSGLGLQTTTRGMAETLFRHRAPGINRRR